MILTRTQTEFARSLAAFAAETGRWPTQVEMHRRLGRAKAPVSNMARRLRAAGLLMPRDQTPPRSDFLAFVPGRTVDPRTRRVMELAIPPEAHME